MTIVVVAEKPSVARDIARVFGARKKAENCLEGNGYLITWALGHLVHFAEPDDYGPQWSGRWAASQLPMIPEHWQLKTERSTVKQFQVVEETAVTLDIGGATFVAKGTLVLEPGWKQVEPDDASRQGAATEGGKGGDGRQAVPTLEEGQRVHIKTMDVLERETQPPKPYTDATLLAAMQNAGREIEDDALAEAMKQTGLGTPATRAEIIEKLIRTGYVERKRLRATEKGRVLIALVAEPLRSPELTAEWEQHLKKVEEGSRTAGAFYGGIVGFVRELVARVAEGPALSPEQVAAAREHRGGRKKQGGKRGSAKPAGLGRCPLCKEGEIVETAKAYGCSRYRDGCGFTIWKRVAGRKLVKKQVEQLQNALASLACPAENENQTLGLQ